MDRGRDVLAVLAQYERTVKPSFEEWILPTRKFADIIVRRPCSAFAPAATFWQAPLVAYLRAMSAGSEDCCTGTWGAVTGH